MTYPTGMVTSLHREIERSINIDIESSSRDGDITVITNLSSVEVSYTVVQGKTSPKHVQQIHRVFKTALMKMASSAYWDTSV